VQVCHNCGYTNWEKSDEVFVDVELAEHPQIKVEPGTILHKAECIRKNDVLTCGNCHRDIEEITNAGKRFLKQINISINNNF
jgi:predicted nucleic-acid-binding Zn-ribbon protein